MPRNRENHPPLFSSMARRREGAGSSGRLDDHDAAGNARHDPITTRKILRPRRKAGPILADDAPGFADPLIERLMFRWIDDVDSTCQHRNRPGVETGLMRGGIDPTRKPGNNRKSSLSELCSELTRKRYAIGRSIARTNDADSRPAKMLRPSLHIQHGRRMLDEGERGRISRLDRENRSRCNFSRGLEFGLRPIARTYAQRLSASATARQLGQRLERGRRAAVEVDELTPRDRTDVFRPDQPQTREPLRIIQGNLRQQIGV